MISLTIPEQLRQENEELRRRLEKAEETIRALRTNGSDARTGEAISPLETADERRDQFLAELSHELRNALGPIRNALQVLQLQGTLNPTVQQARDMIERQAVHLTRLVDDLLDVSLPREPGPMLPAGPAAEPPTAERTHRILVIEDNVDAADSLQMLLRTAGHKVEVAYTGPTGIEIAGTFRPEVVLCDIGLPGGMDGYAVARILRQDPALASVHLLALTGFARDEDRHLAAEAGFERHLTKPINLGELQSALDSLTTHG